MESSPSASRWGAREQAAPVWRAALYTRLSREDGDKPESKIKRKSFMTSASS